MLILNLFEKVAKNSCKQVFSEKVTENGVFDFHYFVQKFSTNNFWGVIF
jgi:hypothetical protein